MTDEYASQLYEWTDKVSANLNANTDNIGLQTFMKEYADSVPLPKMMEIGNFWMHLEVLFSKVWNGADVTEAVQELSEQMNIQIDS